MKTVGLVIYLLLIITACSQASGDVLHESHTGDAFSEPHAGHVISASLSPDLQAVEGTSQRINFPASGQDIENVVLQVDAGAYDRRGTVVTFRLPFAVEPGVYSLSDGNGKSNPLQVDDANIGWFILDNLPAGTSEEFRLHLKPVTNPLQFTSRNDTRVTSQMEPATITFSAGYKKVLSYYHRENDPPEGLDERYRRGGYIHPFYSPDGVVLTNHLNVDQHPHHSGIWSAWTNTLFEGRNPDFWNVHQNRGRVDLDSMITSWDGPVFGGFRSAHRFTDLSGEEPITALNEIWEVSVYASPLGDDVHVFDLTVTQTANSDRPLLLPEYRYGGIGFRGHVDWNDSEKCFFLTSGGLGRDGHATRARWAHMGGYSEGDLAGFAILGHPSNYRFPQTMRIHPREPFFNFAPTQLGDMSIQPGIPYITRYRIITHDGEPDAELIDRLWFDYAYPPSVTITLP